jgi:hypothetical protein
MNTEKRTARIVGALFLTALVTYGVGNGLIESTIAAPDYLNNVSANEIQLIVGGLLELINSAAVVGIAVLLLPILKLHSKNVAFGYLGFRIIEAAILIVGVISALLLITISQEYVQAGAPDDSYFQTLGTLATEEYYLAYQTAVIFLGLGSLPFCYLLYQSKLVPRFLSVLGFIGYALLIIAMSLEIFGIDNLTMILGLPVFLFEIVFAIWLIVKGFSASAIASHSVEADMN